MPMIFGARSWFSLGRGFLSPDALALAARTAGANTLAFADWQEMGGLIEMIEACQRHEIKAVPGVELAVAGSRAAGTLTLFAPHNAGLETLLQVTAGCARKDGELILDPQTVSLSGLVACPGGHTSALFALAQMGDLNGGLQHLELLRQQGARVVAGLDPWSLANIPGISSFYEEIARKTPVIAYRAGFLGSPADTSGYGLVREYFEMGVDPLWSQISPVLVTTETLASQTQFPWTLGTELSAMFPGLGEGHCLNPRQTEPLGYKGMGKAEMDNELASRCQRAMEVMLSRGGIADEKIPGYRERLSTELLMIGKRGFAGYLLHLHDLVGAGRRDGTDIGVGRGSSVNSLTCYLLRLTNVNPVANGAPFERFLTADKKLPDVDIDIGAEKAGAMRASAMASLPNSARMRLCNRWTLNEALEAGARFGGVKDGLNFLERLKSDFGGEMPETLAVLARDEPSVYQKLQAPKFLPILRAAQILTGRPKRYGVHESGVASCVEDLPRRVPVVMVDLPAGGQALCVACSAAQAEARGVLKFEFLASQELDFFRRLMKRIAPACRLPPLSANYFSQEAVAATLHRGYVGGIFQIGNPRYGSLFARIKPSNFEELAQLNALVRLQKFPEVVSQYAGGGRKEAISAMGGVLKETRGVPLFQEQVMRCLHEASGMNLENAERVRDAIAKGNAKGVEEGRKLFVECAVNIRHSTPAQAEKLFHEIAHAGAYCFPKGHALAYSVYVAAGAYFKYHHTEDFICERIVHERNQGRNSSERQRSIAQLCFEARMLGVSVEPVRVARGIFCEPLNGARPGFRLGLDALPGVGMGACQKLSETKDLGKLTPKDLLASQVPSGVVGRLIAMEAFNHLPDKPASLLSKYVPEEARRLAGIVNQSNCPATVEMETFGFMTDQTHPGFPLPAGCQLCSELVEKDGLKGEFPVVGFINGSSKFPRQLPGKKSRFVGDYCLNSGLGDKGVWVSAYFEQEAQCEGFLQRMRQMSPLQPVVSTLECRPSKGRDRFYWDAVSTPIEISADDKVVRVPYLVASHARGEIEVGARGHGKGNEDKGRGRI